MKQNIKKLAFAALCTLLLQNFMTSCSETDLSALSNTKQENAVTGVDSVKSSSVSQNIQVDNYQVTLRDANNLLKSLGKDSDAKLKVYTDKSDTLLYVANYHDGWTIISGDKRLNPIIAESSQESSSDVTPNDNVKFWLETYKDELATIKQEMDSVEIAEISTRSNLPSSQKTYVDFWNKISPTPKPTNASTRSSAEYKWAVVSNTYCDSETSSIVTPHLIETKWGQSEPWNSKLPTDTKANQKCPTGCVAVSLAQIIYYMHGHFGKPTGLYHNINISSSSISGATNNIGFSRSNYVSNSDRWNKMAPTRNDEDWTKSDFETSYVGDFMLDIGNRLNMKYSGTESSASISASALANYNLTYSSSDYNFDNIKKSLQNKKPVNIVAYYKEGKNKKGHSWIIDGIATKTRHFVTEIHFEYTENWMNESEYYDSFDDLKQHYHISSQYETIKEDGGSYTTEYLLMNWGYDGQYNDGLFSKYPSDIWTVDGKDYKYDKKIYYDFK